MKLKFMVLSMSLVCSSVAFAASGAGYKGLTECAYAKQASAHEKPKDQVAAEIFQQVFKPQAPKKSSPIKAVI